MLLTRRQHCLHYSRENRADFARAPIRRRNTTASIARRQTTTARRNCSPMCTPLTDPGLALNYGKHTRAAIVYFLSCVLRHLQYESVMWPLACCPFGILPAVTQISVGLVQPVFARRIEHVEIDRFFERPGFM